MVATLRFEDHLDGVLNFNTWKARVLNLLEEHDLDGYVTSVVQEPVDDNGKITFKENQAKAKRIIFDSMKDHLIPIISPLKIAKECLDTLVRLFETKTPSQKRALKGKLRSIKMTKEDTIATIFTKKIY
jgi:hypothetical protein